MSYQLAKPNLKELVKQEVERHTLSVIFQLEDHIPLKGERIVKDEIKIQTLLEASNMADAISEVKKKKKKENKYKNWKI